MLQAFTGGIIGFTLGILFMAAVLILNDQFFPQTIEENDSYTLTWEKPFDGASSDIGELRLETRGRTFTYRIQPDRDPNWRLELNSLGHNDGPYSGWITELFKDAETALEPQETE